MILLKNPELSHQMTYEIPPASGSTPIWTNNSIWGLFLFRFISHFNLKVQLSLYCYCTIWFNEMRRWRKKGFWDFFIETHYIKCHILHNCNVFPSQHTCHILWVKIFFLKISHVSLCLQSCHSMLIHSVIISPSSSFYWQRQSPSMLCMIQTANVSVRGSQEIMQHFISFISASLFTVDSQHIKVVLRCN